MRKSGAGRSPQLPVRRRGALRPPERLGIATLRHPPPRCRYTGPPRQDQFDPLIRRVVEVLNRYDETRPFQAAVIRLLLLTGCRKGELLTLKWQDYREGKIFLRDSKNGPRTVWLSSAAREVLDRLPRKNEWVFPSPYRYAEHLAEITDFWQEVRAKSGLRDVRPHDLRHTYASIALMHGETVLTIGRLLGHDHPGTTLKYTNFADAAAREAVDAVSSALRRV